MIRSRTLGTSLLFCALFTSRGTAQDLSKYRDFQFGMRLESVAKQIHVAVSVARTTHQRPGRRSLTVLPITNHIANRKTCEAPFIAVASNGGNDEDGAGQNSNHGFY